MIEILHRYTKAVIYRAETAESIADAVKAAAGSGANLTNANLTNANLAGADLTRADLTRAENTELAQARTSICAEGEIVGYKKTQQGIVKLRIPADSPRCNATGRKCRAARAVVLETPNHEPAFSQHDPVFKYVEGETVRPTVPFDENRWRECAAGIHFYITRLEAEAHR